MNTNSIYIVLSNRRTDERQYFHYFLVGNTLTKESKEWQIPRSLWLQNRNTESLDSETSSFSASLDVEAKETWLGNWPCLHRIGPPKNKKKNFFLHHCWTNISTSNSHVRIAYWEKPLFKITGTFFVKGLDSENNQVVSSPVKSWIDEDHPTTIIKTVTFSDKQRLVKIVKYSEYEKKDSLVNI